MGTDVSLLRFLALGDGFFDAFEPLGAALLQPLVGFPGLLSRAAENRTTWAA